MWLLFRTLRLRLVIDTPGTNPYDPDGDERFLYSVWHDSMVIPVFGGRHLCSTALTSQHGDGSFVAAVLKCKNIGAIRGSTNRISTGSIRDLMDKAATRNVVITPDGPRGPDRRMSSGIAYLASRTGRGIVPTAYACSRCWRIRGSWSSLIIPKPFATVVLLAGDPVYLPSGLSPAEIKQQVSELQALMDRLNGRAEAMASAGGADRAGPQQADPPAPPLPAPHWTKPEAANRLPTSEADHSPSPSAREPNR